ERRAERERRGRLLSTSTRAWRHDMSGFSTPTGPSPNAELRELEESRELTADDQPSSDEGSDLTERAYEAGSAEDLTEQLRALERAETRLVQGTYGRSLRGQLGSLTSANG